MATTRRFDSEVLDCASYSYRTGRLDLTLQSGSTYRAYRVPSTKWRALLASPSPGRYFNTVLKPEFRIRKV